MKLQNWLDEDISPEHLHIIINKGEPVAFEVYGELAKDHNFPSALLFGKKYWKNFDETSAIHFLMDAERANVLMWILETLIHNYKDNEKQWTDKENTDRLLDYFAKRKSFVDNHYTHKIIKEMIKNRAMQNTSSKLPNKPLKLKESKVKSGDNMNDLREYLEDKEEEKFEEELEEGILNTIGTILGYTISAGIFAFGGTLLIIGGKKFAIKMKSLWQSILNKRKNTQQQGKSVEEIMHEIESDAKVKAERIKLEEKKRTFEDKLHEVYTAIEEKDFDRAKREFYSVDRTIQNNPDAHKAIMLEITKVLREPPLYVKSPGNGTYQAIKKILNIRVARAAAKATEMALANAAGIE